MNPVDRLVKTELHNIVALEAARINKDQRRIVKAAITGSVQDRVELAFEIAGCDDFMLPLTRDDLVFAAHVARDISLIPVTED